jgi:hypothetical protein
VVSLGIILRIYLVNSRIIQWDLNLFRGAVKCARFCSSGLQSPVLRYIPPTLPYPLKIWHSTFRIKILLWDTFKHLVWEISIMSKNRLRKFAIVRCPARRKRPIAMPNPQFLILVTTSIPDEFKWDLILRFLDVSFCDAGIFLVRSIGTFSRRRLREP